MKSIGCSERGCSWTFLQWCVRECGRAWRATRSRAWRCSSTETRGVSERHPKRVSSKRSPEVSYAPLESGGQAMSLVDSLILRTVMGAIEREVVVEVGDVTIFVGPNNSGKSLAL